MKNHQTKQSPLDSDLYQIKDLGELSARDIFSSLITNESFKFKLVKKDPGDDWDLIKNVFRIVDLKYGLLKKLGTGGFGTVYLAVELATLEESFLDRFLAIKMPSEDYYNIVADQNSADVNAIKKQLRQEFQKEARNLLSLCECDNVVQVVSVDENTPYIAMEYCEGGTLADRIRNSNYNLIQVLDWIKQICVGLVAGHDQRPNRLVHLDLKPTNILFKENVLKIADYGISKLAKDSLTVHSQKLGGISHVYASPEQFDGAFKEKSDIWALGVIIYELLSGPGQVPFPGVGPSVGFAIMNKPHPKITPRSGINPPKRLLQLVDQCLDKTSQKRPTAVQCLTIIEGLREERAGPNETTIELSPMKSIRLAKTEIETTDRAAFNTCTESRDMVSPKQRNFAAENLANRELKCSDFSKCDFRLTNLSSANLTECSFNSANLQRANLRRSTLIGADLQNADLRQADLRHADLSCANLSKALLEGANLQGAILNGANLKGVDLLRVELLGIIEDSKTEWPEDFRKSSRIHQ